jgi:hypothetical protein
MMAEARCSAQEQTAQCAYGILAAAATAAVTAATAVTVTAIYSLQWVLLLTALSGALTMITLYCVLLRACLSYCKYGTCAAIDSTLKHYSAPVLAAAVAVVTVAVLAAAAAAVAAGAVRATGCLCRRAHHGSYSSRRYSSRCAVYGLMISLILPLLLLLLLLLLLKRLYSVVVRLGEAVTTGALRLRTMMTTAHRVTQKLVAGTLAVTIPLHSAVNHQQW